MDRSIGVVAFLFPEDPYSCELSTGSTLRFRISGNNIPGGGAGDGRAMRERIREILGDGGAEESGKSWEGEGRREERG